jgi:ArsR family transcriptional regulator, arsenate/arsenite/antimonite-responsive transcriptional repressor
MKKTIPLTPDGRRPLPRARRAGAPMDVELARLAKALGHPARVAIVRLLLGKGECVCGDIVGRLPLAQATVSQHLKVLKDAGWIQGSIDGPRVCYCARRETGRKFLELAQALASQEEGETS